MKVRLLWITGGALVLGSLIAMSIPILQGKTTYPEYTIATSETSVAQAREAAAETWAPDPLREAESALRRAKLAARIQHTRLYPFRDYTLARALLDEASSRARTAREQAQETRAEAQAVADSVIAHADEILGTTVEFSKAMHINPYDRSLISRAKIDLTEAELLYEGDAFVEAAAAARLSIDKAFRVGDRAAALASRYTDASLVKKWRGWIEETIAWSRRTGSAAIIVNKEKHLVSLYAAGKEAKTWRGELGYNSVRDKTYGGDNATPEGRYKITAKKGLGQSRYHRALLINYPNDDDRAEFSRLKKAGQLPSRVGLGGLIEIHGEGGRGRDWTNGCVALANHEMDDLWKRVDVGTPVTIVGGDGSGGIYTDMVQGRRASKTAKPEFNGSRP